MVSISTTIKKWANTLPFWEQLALDKVIAGGQFTKSDYDELIHFLLEEHGLTGSKKTRPKLPFLEEKNDMEEITTERVKLVKIFNTKKINALAPNQTLTFGPKLTVIYGRNASGKSGYARFLGCAGFTRGDKDVLPDITKPSTPDPMSADIEVLVGNRTQTINYQIGTQSPELSSFYIFDNSSVDVHLTKSNKFSFSPAGLSYLTRLTEVVDKIRERLDTEIEKHEKPREIRIFHGKSSVSESVSTIYSGTTFGDLKKLAMIKPEEKKRIKDLDIEIAKLKTLDIPNRIGTLKQKIEDINNLNKRLNQLEKELSNDAISNIRKSLKSYLDIEEETRDISVEQFKSSYFTQTGGEAWHRFIEAARTLAEAEQNKKKAYPQPSDHCLLCHQELSPDARQHLIRLWKFLKSRAELNLKEAQQTLRETRDELSSIDFKFFNDHLVSYRHLKEHDMQLLSDVESFIEACRKCRESLLEIINLQKDGKIPEIPASPSHKIEKVIHWLLEQKYDLEKENIPKKISELNEELLTLTHRKDLAQHLPAIGVEIEKHNWIKEAQGINLSTRHITTKYNKLFEQLVTDRYIQLFEQTLKDLQCSLMVKVKASASKGMAYKHLMLEIDPNAHIHNVTLDRVLSGGEQHAVALADFLTEVKLDSTSNGIIMDDPVTSLDLEWMNHIASMLVNEAKNRQVIVFTHDRPFLYLLKKHAEQGSVDFATHWITRGGPENKPGYVCLNNSPALEQEYRKATRAREFHKMAKDEQSASKQEYYLQQGFEALRSCYEALIIFELFKHVVMRFEERVSVERLKSIVWDKKIVEEIINKYGFLSRYIEAHLHTDMFDTPTCKMLMNEIEAFEAIGKKLKELKNN
jgi:ABC-type dipeptide/oligopeptide/nickel transport system ATPase subunit